MSVSFQLYYNYQIFNTVEDLLEGYHNGSVDKIKLKAPTREDFMKASSNPHGPPMFDKKRGPIPTELNGRRFSVQGNIVKYGKWHTEIATRGTAAIGLFNTRFDGRLVTYELSLQEAISFYSGYNPKTATSQYVDAGIGLGTGFTGLRAGTDCPENAVFLDVVGLWGSHEPEVFKNAVCIFEMNFAIPSRRHHAFQYGKGNSENKGFFYYSGSPDNALVIRTVTTPYNYDYIIDYMDIDLFKVK